MSFSVLSVSSVLNISGLLSAIHAYFNDCAGFTSGAGPGFTG